MVNYKGKDYKSSSAIVRELYSTGKISDLSSSKNAIANELKISVPAVNDAINRFKEKMSIAKKIPIVKKDKKKKKLSPFPAKQKISEVIEESTQSKKAITPTFMMASEDGKKLKNISQEIMDDEEDKQLYKNPIIVNFAPNPWGLPITSPPLKIIDQRYKSKKSACSAKSYETPTIEH